MLDLVVSLYSMEENVRSCTIYEFMEEKGKACFI